jgi:hypothetical protein
MAAGYYRDLTNQKFEKLTAISPYSHKFVKNGKKTSTMYWDCKCDCGNDFRATSQGLVSGNTKSCGCFKVKPELKDKDREKRIGRAVYNSNIKDKNKRKFESETDIPFDAWFKMSQEPCFYCGLKSSNEQKDTKRGKLITDTIFYYNGIDRVDSSKSYALDNVVTCCKYCNWFKLDDPTQEFLRRAFRVYDHFNLGRDDYLVFNRPWLEHDIPEKLRPSPLTSPPEQNKLDRSVDLIGQKIGTILIASRDFESNSKNYKYNCSCERCGKTQSLYESNLFRQKSCKCNYRYLSRDDAFWNSAYQDNVLGPNRRIWNTGTDITLSMYEYVASLNCFYCNDDPSCFKTERIGGEVFKFSTLDKLNPKEHYHWNNIAPCCKKCNFGKNKQDIYGFLTSIKRLVEFQRKTRPFDGTGLV